MNVSHYHLIEETSTQGTHLGVIFVKPELSHFYRDTTISEQPKISDDPRRHQQPKLGHYYLERSSTGNVIERSGQKNSKSTRSSRFLLSSRPKVREGEVPERRIHRKCDIIDVYTGNVSKGEDSPYDVNR